jgi:hypothetical protein
VKSPLILHNIWAFPLAERKINPPPPTQIKLAWKVHCPSGHGLSTLHTKYSLTKKTSPPTSHHPHPGRKLQCQTLSRGMVCSRQPWSFQGVHLHGRPDGFRGSFINSFLHSYLPDRRGRFSQRIKMILYLDSYLPDRRGWFCW